MGDRTTINVPKWVHQEAKEVKQNDPNVDSWTDVLAFYVEYQPKVSNGDIGQSQEPMQEFDMQELKEHIDGLDTSNGPVTLEASEYTKIAREVAGELR